jgi:cell division protein FtsL
VLLAVLPAAAALMGYVWLNLELIDIGYEVHRLERTLRQEDRRQRELLVEAAYLTSPHRVQTLATQELGMVPAALDQLVFLEELP